MRRDRMDDEELLVNGFVGGEALSKQEQRALKRESQELKHQMEEAKKQPIKE